MSRPNTNKSAEICSLRPLNLLAGVSSFLRLECLALTENALGFFRVWIGLRPVAAVRSVERLRMSADAHFIADHVTLVTSVPRVGVGGNKVFPVGVGAKVLLVRKGRFHRTCKSLTLVKRN
jgi:hypothetical protein